MSQLVWKISPLSSTFEDVPSTPGVYQFMNNNQVLYVGKSVNLRARLRSHFQNTKLDTKEFTIWNNAKFIRYTITDNDFSALLLESQLIKKYQPPYNLIVKDDTSFLYISVNLQDNFPKPRLVRGRDLPRPISNSQTSSRLKVFGPFPTRYVADQILKSIRRLIPFCTGKQLGKRACFYSHLGLCSPCPNTISNNPDPKIRQTLQINYRRQISALVKILSGNTSRVIKSLTRQMQLFSVQDKFEEALALREKIENFQYWIDTHSFSETRPLVLHQSAKRLQSLQLLLQPYLGKSSLARIECYDASNLLSGTDTASLVVLTNGQIDKSEYRRFKIKNPLANSDFARLKEALTRRFHHSWPIPNLVVLDGGKPQLRMTTRVFDQLPHPPALIGLAKAPDRLIISYSSKFITLHPPLDHPGFSLLKLLRDESHRFANAYRRTLEKKSMYN